MTPQFGSVPQGLLVGGIWVPVSSSNVDAARRVGPDLEVRFLAKGKQPRRTWRYPGAAGELANLVNAPSAGKFVKWVLRAKYGDGYEV